MKFNIFSVLLIIFLVSGCGGESSSKSEESSGSSVDNSNGGTDADNTSSSDDSSSGGTDTTEVVIEPDLPVIPDIETGVNTGFFLNEVLKGSSTQSELMLGTLVDDLEIQLNSRLYGSIDNNSELAFTYVAEKAASVMLFLRGEDSGVGLKLTSSLNRFSFRSEWEHTARTASAALVFPVEEGRTYYLSIESDAEYSNSQNFELVFTEANRATLSLSNNEYLIAHTRRIDYQDCYAASDPSLDSRVFTEEFRHYFVANFTAGYLADVDKREHQIYKYLGDNNFEPDRIASISENLVVDPDTGEMTGTGEGRAYPFRDGIRYSCDTTIAIDGEVVL